MSSEDIGKIEVNEREREIVRFTIARIASYIKSRKLDKGTLTEQGTLGFNLACDFLSHELLKMQEFHNKDLLNE